MNIAATDVLIVGGGHAGAQVAISLRQQGYEGTVCVVGDEPVLPYERPPLSKDYLAGAKVFERLLIRPAAFWAERGISMQLGGRVERLAPDEHRVLLSTGEAVAYRHLVWAAGGAARRLSCPGHDLAGVHGIRSKADVDRLVAELPAVQQVVVVGGGYIGLEAAAVLSKLGKQVSVLESADRVLARVAGAPLSRFFEGEHRAHGVDLRLGTSVSGLEGESGRVRAVKLADGSALPAQMVVVGIGIEPVVQPLLAAGAVGGNGVSVDHACRTNLPDVYAIGDVACRPHPYAGGAAVRLESVQNATEQANAAARSILGLPVDRPAIPWFWSNQYDLRLQTIGLSTAHEQVICRGDMASRSFSLVYLKAGQVIALDCVNAAKDFVQGRELVMRDMAIDLQALGDPAVPLKSLVSKGVE